MTPNDEQYERLARYLDGLDVNLSAEEQALAEEIRRDEAVISARLDVELPVPASERAARRLRAAAAGSTGRLWRIAGRLAVAAAVILLVAGLLWKTLAPTQPLRRDVQIATAGRDEVPLAVLIESIGPAGDLDLEFDLIAEKLAGQESEIAAGVEQGGWDDKILDLQEQIGKFWELDNWNSLAENGSAG